MGRLIFGKEYFPIFNEVSKDNCNHPTWLSFNNNKNSCKHLFNSSKISQVNIAIIFDSLGKNRNLKVLQKK